MEGARIAGRMSFRVGSGAAEPDESVVELAPVMSALFDGAEPLLEREALQALHALPGQRYWLLQDIQALLERAALSNRCSCAWMTCNGPTAAQPPLCARFRPAWPGSCRLHG